MGRPVGGGGRLDGSLPPNIPFILDAAGSPLPLRSLFFLPAGPTTTAAQPVRQIGTASLLDEGGIGGRYTISFYDLS